MLEEQVSAECQRVGSSCSSAHSCGAGIITFSLSSFFFPRFAVVVSPPLASLRSAGSSRTLT
jgi:hypothetical protein